jgi:transposase
VHKRSELITHIQTTNAQYNLPSFGQKLSRAKNRQALRVAERFTDPSVKKSMEVNLALVDRYEELIADLELYLERTVKVDDAQTYYLLKTIPGVGKVLGLILLYEIHDIRRFETVGDFMSYARLVRPVHESAGKKQGYGQKKIGNAHLRWALGEAATLLLRESDEAKRFVARLEKKRGKAKALGILAAKLGRCVYWMLRRQQAFDVKRFWGM